jgi:hypothetical protein
MIDYLVEHYKLAPSEDGNMVFVGPNGERVLVSPDITAEQKEELIKTLEEFTTP